MIRLRLTRRHKLCPVPCRCDYHRGWREGYLQAAAEAAMGEQEAAWRRFLTAYEVPSNKAAK